MTATPEYGQSFPEAGAFRLEDGPRLRIRPAGPADREGLLRAFRKLSSVSRYRRFFAHKRSLNEADLCFLSELDGDRQCALLAVLDDTDEEIVGVARYARLDEDPQTAEMAVTVVDDWQRRGIGRRLLEQLLQAAARRGIRRVRVQLLAENLPMRRLLDDLFGACELKREGDVLSGDLPLPAPGDDTGIRASPLLDLLRLAAAEAVLPLQFGLSLSRQQLAALKRRFF